MTESDFFRNYSGVLCEDLEFEILDDGLIVTLNQPPEMIRYKHSYIDHRFLKRAEQSNQALLKACNSKQRNIKSILDLTGGWGIDSFILASHGHRVTSIEHNQLLHMISAHSLHCARTIKQSSAAANRITMMHGDSIEFLQYSEQSYQYDCIYLDPMFPEHKSSAKSAKALQILQKLTQNRDIQACFELALKKAVNRVVVKSPAKSGALFENKPDLVYREKTVRFDVYLTV